MKKILIIFYTQSGQLKQIVDSVTSPLSQDFNLFFEELKPDPPYPFPWRGMPFFQVFPESVKEIPCTLKPLTRSPEEDYDLVILAYQVWFLSPSIPIVSFLQSEEAKKILKGKPVITISGVRNMWIMAHERVKARIAECGGKLAGNIVLADPSPNLLSVITIVRWMMKGERSPFRKFGISFPPAGVPEKLISEASQFGVLIKEAITNESFYDLQPQLVMHGAVKVDPVLMNIEKRGKMMFGFWAKMILRKGGYNEPQREGRLKLFKYYLFAVIYLISPIASLIFSMIFKINPAAADRIIKRYSH